MDTYMLPLSVFFIKELLLEDGSSPFGDWFLNLDTQAAVKVQVALARMEQGNLSNVKWFRVTKYEYESVLEKHELGNKVFEMEITTV